MVNALMAGNNSENSLNEIVRDNRSGSTELSLKVADFYSRCSSCNGDFMKDAMGRIGSAHIGMGLVRNTNRIMFSAWENDPHSLVEESEKLKLQIKTLSEKAVKNSPDILPDGVSVATISNSSAVRNALVLNRKKIARVYVLESRPGLEGQSMAEELDRNGIDTVLMVDAAVQKASQLAGIAICGSDSVLSDYSLVHKVGTYPLFMSMRKENRKTYSLSISLKFEAEFDGGSYPSFAVHDPREIVQGNLEALNLYFDITPPTLITAYVTDRGIHLPRSD